MYPQKLQDAIVTTRDGEGNELECKVRVVDVTPTNVFITAPIDQNGYAMFLTVGSRVNLGYVAQGYAHFDALVKRHVRERIPMVVLEKPPIHEISRDQRRQNFRVPVTLRTTIAKDGQNVLLNLLDLSAGGFLATSAKRVWSLGDEILGELTLPTEKGNKVIQYIGQVTRVGYDGDQQEVLYGVEFRDMGARSDIIMRYCMERQRRYLRTLSEQEPG